MLNIMRHFVRPWPDLVDLFITKAMNDGQVNKRGTGPAALSYMSYLGLQHQTILMPVKLRMNTLETSFSKVISDR